MIYLDNAATTRIDPIVLEALLPFLNDKYGNASSTTHPFGWIADEAVKRAREEVATSIGALPEEIVFTSGATESINMILKGIFQSYQIKGKHIITTSIEHNAVLDTCSQLEEAGAEITYLEVDSDGLIDPANLAAHIRPDTILVAVMWANNETGVIQPVSEIARICSEKKVLFFSDATQALGKVSINVNSISISTMAFSAHKLYGPKGAGILYVRRQSPSVKIKPLIAGGGQENGLRGGTLNVPAIVGAGKACALIDLAENEKISRFRDMLETELTRQFDFIVVQGGKVIRLPNISNLMIRDIRASRLIAAVNSTLAISTGAACSSGSLDPSHVMLAMGLSEAEARCAIRISLSKYTMASEIEETIDILSRAIESLH